MRQAAQCPPRNGEGDHAQHGEGVERVRHRTVGAEQKTVRLARTLGKTMSLPEVLLWQQLRSRPGGHKFRRQYPIAAFIADFVCLDLRLIIEIDGEAHNRGDRPARDAARDRALAAIGYVTVRIAAKDVLGNMEGVVSLILKHCACRPLHHSPASSGPPPRSGEDLT